MLASLPGLADIHLCLPWLTPISNQMEITITCMDAMSPACQLPWSPRHLPVSVTLFFCLFTDFHRASYLCGRIVSCLPTHLVSQTFSASVLVQCVAITIFTLNHVRHVPSGGDVSAASSPKGEGGGGGIDQGGEKTWVKTPQVEVMLSTDEQKSLDIILGFTGRCRLLNFRLVLEKK